MADTLSLTQEPVENYAAEPAVAPVRKVRTDHHLWGTYILLVIFAVIELFSASIQEVSDGSIFRPILRHGMFLASGLVFMLILQLIHYRKIFDAIPYFCGPLPHCHARSACCRHRNQRSHARNHHCRHTFFCPQNS